MTNWMTAAGIALIAGGLAILVGFRHVLWTRNEQPAGGERRRTRVPRAIEAPRRPVALSATPAVPPVVVGEDAADDEPADATVPGPRRSGRRALVAAAAVESESAPLRLVDEHPEPVDADADDVVIDLGQIPPVRRPRGGLARIGLADDDDETSGDVFADDEPDEDDEQAGQVFAENRFGDREPGAEAEAEPDGDDHEPEDDEDADQPGMRELPARRAERFGDRIDGWVRPQYRDEQEPGEYWTPVPESSYADAGYGWPVPVERLPPVPAYPPRSGFDPEPIDEADPTAVVPQWPPAKPSGRIELPRSWAHRNTNEAPRRNAVLISRRRPAGSTETLPAVGDFTEMLPAVDDGEPAAARRRPRPRPDEPDRSTVYRSRHAADPA